jgi:uncharacterized protein (DUF1778 family)
MYRQIGYTNPAMRTPKTQMNFRISEAEKQELAELAAALPDTSASDIVREAVKEKIVKLRRKIGAKDELNAEVAAN